MSDNNENGNEESDSLSPLNNNRVSNMNLLNNSNSTNATSENTAEPQNGNEAVVVRLREQVSTLNLAKWRTGGYDVLKANKYLCRFKGSKICHPSNKICSTSVRIKSRN